MEQKKFSKISLQSKEIDYSKWFLDVAKYWELFEYSSTPWCIIFLPKAVNIWEKLKHEIDKNLETLWVQNLYLPLLIPMSFFEKEKEHIDWFAPELAVVTIWWWKNLEDKLAIRPTSETLFCEFFKNKLQTYRDLPLLFNQWVNVLRREKRTRPFLRTAEFYWQEWHTLHETKQQAIEFAKNIMNNVYIKIIKEFMAIDWIAWIKSESEKFAWADTTYTFEPMMSNWWALQICTSHILWNWFMENFDVSYIDKDWKKNYPFYTSWGLSTRSIWGMISSHSDNNWLIIPPKLSNFIAVILPIYWKDNQQLINNHIEKICKIICLENKIVPFKWEYFKKCIWLNKQVLIDYRNIRIWEKISDFELSWYPIRIEYWQREIEQNNCVICSRITWEKLIIWLHELNEIIEKFINEWQKELFQRSQNRLRNNVVACKSIDDIWESIENWKFAIFEWDKNPKLEIEIKEKFKATTRCIPFDWQFCDEIIQLKNKNNVKVIIARNF